MVINKIVSYSFACDNTLGGKNEDPVRLPTSTFHHHVTPTFFTIFLSCVLFLFLNGFVKQLTLLLLNLQKADNFGKELWYYLVMGKWSYQFYR